MFHPPRLPCEMAFSEMPYFALLVLPSAEQQPHQVYDLPMNHNS